MLEAAIASAQSAGSNLEVIVVDDASTDATASVCKRLPGIKYLRSPKNVGQACARNIGIANSRGEYLAFLDDDDLRLPGSIDKQVEILSRNGRASLVYGRVFIGDSITCSPTGELRPSDCPAGDIFWTLLRRNFIYVPSVLVRKEALKAVGMFDPDPRLRGTEDWDAWIRLAEKYDVEVINEPMAVYRDFSRTSGQTSSNRPRMYKSSACTLAKALNLPRALEGDMETRKKLWEDSTDFFWEHLVEEGRAALSARRYRDAVTSFVTAMRLKPARAARFGAIAHFAKDTFGTVRSRHR